VRRIDFFDNPGFLPDQSVDVGFSGLWNKELCGYRADEIDRCHGNSDKYQPLQPKEPADKADQPGRQSADAQGRKKESARGDDLNNQ